MNQEYVHEKTAKAPIPEVTRLPEPCADQSLLPLYLEGRRGLSYALAYNNGWFLSTDAGDEHLRVVIPCTNTLGYAYWQARAIDHRIKKRYQSPPYASTDSIAIVWPPPELQLQRKAAGIEERKAVIVEGAMDALAVAEFGYVGVAIMGIQPQGGVLDHIAARFRHYQLSVLLDSAAAGEGVKLASVLASRYGIRSQFGIPPGKDLAAMTRAERGAFLG